MTAPEFVSLEDAAAMKTGTRITFIPGLQALYAEALKNLCYVKKIPIIRALHPMMGIDKATGQDRQARLYELTSQTSLPTMFHNEERPRNVWTEQLALVEQIGGYCRKLHWVDIFFTLHGRFVQKRPSVPPLAL